MTAAPAVPPAAPATTPTAAVTSAASGSGSDTKVPRTLPPGIWNSLVKHYQSIQLQGRDHVFPVTELIGAESILARMHHELTVSGQFTPVMLGEILQKRSFNAAGEVNPLQKSPKKSSMLTFDEGNQLVTADEPVWSPRSLLAIIDGINSIRWAMILVRSGEERRIHSYADWMVAKARSQPQRGEQFVSYWQWAGWHMAMAMRSGSTFQESAENIMGEVNKFNEIMVKEVAPDKKKVTTTEPPKGGKGKTQKGSKGKGSDRWTPYPPRDRWQNQSNQWRTAQSSQWWQRAAQRSIRLGPQCQIGTARGDGVWPWTCRTRQSTTIRTTIYTVGAISSPSSSRPRDYRPLGVRWHWHRHSGSNSTGG